MNTQVFVASTAFNAVVLKAAFDSGLYERPGVTRRLLLTSINDPIPETSKQADQWVSFGPLSAAMDDVVSWNDTIHPQHPYDWEPRPKDRAIWNRLLRERWKLGTGSLEVSVGSVQAPPARALAQLFDDSEVSVFLDGLMSYAPLRHDIGGAVLSRIGRLIHLDLVPGLRPLVLSGTERDVHALDGRRLREAVAAMPRSLTVEWVRGSGQPGSTGLVLGQYLASLGLVSEREESELYRTMVERMLRRGFRRVVFKPHPSLPDSSLNMAVAVELSPGQSVGIVRGGLAEQAFETLEPELVVSCFSTGLATARTIYGIPTARLGTGPLVERLVDSSNSNRIPVVITDATVPQLLPDGSLTQQHCSSATELQTLVEAVAHDMQPERMRHLRPSADAYRRRQEALSSPRYLSALPPTVTDGGQTASATSRMRSRGRDLVRSLPWRTRRG